MAQNNSSGIKNVLYVLFIALLAWGIQIYIEVTLNEIVYPLLNWFNKQGLVTKIFLIIIGAPIVTYLLAAFVGLVHGLVVLFGFKEIPRSELMNIFCAVIFYVNVFLCAKAVFYTIPKWSFWYIVEFIWLCVYCFAANYCILYTYNRDRKQDREIAKSTEMYSSSES